MNSKYNVVLKQRNSLKSALEKFQSGSDTSAGIQGEIQLALEQMNKSIDNYQNGIRHEMIPEKKEEAQRRALVFREELKDMRISFQSAKVQQQEQNRESLLARRPNKSGAPHEHPHTPMSRMEYDEHERNFADRADHQLDDFISQAQSFLENLSDQHSILKKAQTKLLDTANTLGLSKNVIRYIERRTTQDKWIFYGGLAVTIFLIWAMIHYLR